MLWINRYSTGSLPATKTIGIRFVTSFAAMETVVENVTSRSAPSFSNSAAAFLMASRSPPLSLTKRRIEPGGASVSSTCRSPSRPTRYAPPCKRTATTFGLCSANAGSHPAAAKAPSTRKNVLGPSLDHLVGSDKHSHGNSESDGSRGSEIYGEGECVRLNYREFADLRPLEDSPDIEADLSVASNEARAVAHKPA